MPKEQLFLKTTILSRFEKQITAIALKGSALRFLALWFVGLESVVQHHTNHSYNELWVHFNYCSLLSSIYQ